MTNEHNPPLPDVAWIATNSTEVGVLAYQGMRKAATERIHEIVKRYPAQSTIDMIIAACAQVYVTSCGVEPPKDGKYYAVQFRNQHGEIINPDEHPELRIEATAMRIINAVSNEDDDMLSAFLRSIEGPGPAGEVLKFILERLTIAGQHR